MNEREFRIDPRPAELGGGWRLRLLDWAGEEMGGGVFAQDEYGDALDEGEAWIRAGHPEPQPPTASRRANMRNREEEEFWYRQLMDAQAAKNCLTDLSWLITRADEPVPQVLLDVFNTLATELGFDPEEQLEWSLERRSQRQEALDENQ